MHFYHRYPGRDEVILHVFTFSGGQWLDKKNSEWMQRDANMPVDTFLDIICFQMELWFGLPMICNLEKQQIMTF
jgi:hypothetical protein